VGEDIFSLAKERAAKFGLENILVASNSGESVERAQNVFGPGFTFFAVGNPPSSRKKGLALHSGILDSTKERLEQRGIRVIHQDASIFQACANRSIGIDSFGNANAAYEAHHCMVVRRYTPTLSYAASTRLRCFS